MTLRRTVSVGLFAGLVLLATGTPAGAQPRASEASPDPIAAFDRGVELLPKDPFAARERFQVAADGFERQLNSPLSQWERARLWYNIGAARQLADDNGPAVLALRRAELLAPATAGLRERLAAARRAARGDASPPGGADAPFDAWSFARDWALTVPRAWLWRTAIAGWLTAWALVLLRMVVGAGPIRPSRSLVAACFLATAAPAGMLSVHEALERKAFGQAVVMTDSTARTEPDDLTGGLAPSGALKAGTEMSVVERRVGGNGEPWVRVRATPVATEQAQAPLWLPESAVEVVSEPERSSTRP